MIIVFPMLTDEGISDPIRPGICKALEKFILIYEMDAIMKITGWTILGIGSKLAHQMVSKQKRESVDLLEAGAGGIKPGWQNYVDPDDEDESDDMFEDEDSDKKKKATGPGKEVFNILKGLHDIGTVKVDMPKDQSLSVEPTYVTVQTTIGTRIIGVKVIPFPVKTSKYTLAELLTADAALNFIDTQVYKISRKAIRGFWALCRALRIPFIKDTALSGDPEKDILWAQSYHKRYVFCLLNYADFTQSDLFKNAGGILKLHSLGWNSFIAADGVNKRAIFCMKEFHGLCSSVPYSYIMSSLGKEHSKVYSDLEGLGKAASPFFRTSLSQKKLFSESNIIQNYLKKLGG